MYKIIMGTVSVGIVAYLCFLGWNDGFKGQTVTVMGVVDGGVSAALVSILRFPHDVRIHDEYDRFLQQSIVSCILGIVLFILMAYTLRLAHLVNLIPFIPWAIGGILTGVVIVHAYYVGASLEEDVDR